MDFNSLLGQSSNAMSVLDAIKNDPNLLSELKENPQETLSKLGIQLNDEELGIIQKLGSISELEGEVQGIFSQIKGLFGFK